MNYPYQVTLFRAKQLQRLRNVRIHSPSIIQIISGSKRFFWKGNAIDVSPSQLLLCETHASFNFENLPYKGQFLSRVFSFHSLPTQAMLELSREHNSKDDRPLLVATNTLQDILNVLFSFKQQKMSNTALSFWVMGLYQQLAEIGALHQLFPGSNTRLSQKLSRYLSHTPSEKHTLESVAQHFAMSRATLIRRLKQEDTQYREVLAEVRLNHALLLIQNGTYNVELLAQSCGYQSEGRFSQRFKRTFGLTPPNYIKTLTGKARVVENL